MGIPKEVFRNEQKDCLLKGILKTIECLAGLLPESELEHDMCIQDQSCDAHVIIAQSCIFEKSPQPRVKKSKIHSDTGISQRAYDIHKSTKSAEKRMKKKNRKEKKRLKKIGGKDFGYQSNSTSVKDDEKKRKKKKRKEKK